MFTGDTMIRTKQEETWLADLATRVQDSIRNGSQSALVKGVRIRVRETEAYMDGWWTDLGKIAGTESHFNIFIDNSLGKSRRSLWYGASSNKRSAVEDIDQVGRRRWPYTQVHLDGYTYSASEVKYDDPILDRAGDDEFYYGWYEEEAPATHKPAAKSQAGRIVEKFSAILAQLAENESDADLLTRLDALDGLRNATVRLEQGILRSFLLAGHDSASCALCGDTFPSDLLVAAHIKRRADCAESERRNYKNNLMAVCTFGCDELFERGYVSVREGRIARSSGKTRSAPVEAKISQLTGRLCLSWNPKSAPFFKSHYERAMKKTSPRFI